MKKAIFIALLLLGSFLSEAQKDSTFNTSGLLELSLEELMNVNVYTASKKIQKASDAPAIISVITYEDIRKMGVTSLIDVLKYVPGIETSMGSDGFYRLSIRGARKDGNVLMLINGHHVNDFYSGRSIFDLPVDFIDKIEIVRGPSSALFGSNAVAGVINVFTVKEKKITASVGTNGLFEGSLNYDIEKDKIKWNISSGYTQSKGANGVIEEDAAYLQPWSLTNGNKSYETERWNKDIYLNTDFSYGNLKFSLFDINHKNGDWSGTQYVAAPGSKIQSNQMISNILYDYKISDVVTLSPKIYCSSFSHDHLYHETPENYLSNTSGDLFFNGKQVHEKYDAISYGGELAINIKVNDHFEILTGNVYEYQFVPYFDLKRNYKIVGDVYKGEFGNYDNIALTQNKKHRDIFAYFIQGNYTLEKINFTAGLRYDDYSDFGHSYNPRLGITYHASKIVCFKGLYGKAFRAPTFLELYDNTSLGNVYGVKGNEHLSPENIQTTELGAEFSYKRVILRYNVFYNINKNLIRVYDPHGTGSIGIYENIGNEVTYGNEAEAIFVITPKINFFTNYSQYISEFEWNKNVARKSDLTYFEKQSSCDKQLKNIPRIRLNAGLNCKVYKFVLFAGCNYGSKSENNKRFYLEEDRHANIPYYLQGNFSITYDYNKFQFRIAANNLGKKYSDPDESTNIDAFGTNGLIQPTETFILEISYKF
jgi:outer membrane receptor for ferrienterochelin and colicins